MPRIAHIAVKVEDLDKAADFYEKVFGLAPRVSKKSTVIFCTGVRIVMPARSSTVRIGFVLVVR